MPKRIKLLLLIPHLGGGGAERVTALLARHLDQQQFEIHLALITTDAPGAESTPPDVAVHRLNLQRIRQAWLPLIRLIRTERPAIILSNMAHLNFLILLLRPFLPAKSRILIRQNTTASASLPSRLTSLCYTHIYPRADAVICQSQAMADDLADHFGITRHKLHVLANPIESTPRPSPVDHGLQLLTVGRLAHEKGLDLLLHALIQIRKQHPKIHLTILGTGPQESNLRQLCRKLDIQPQVTFTGHARPADFYAQTTLFVLPSRHEGIPNALFEAASAGLPIIATPCSKGVTELLDNCPGCWLTPAISVEAIAATILQALKTLETQPPRYEHPFLAPFELKTAIGTYECLLLQVAHKGHP